MGANGIWILLMGVVGLFSGAVITRWMSPIGSKSWGFLAGILGGVLGIVLLEVLAGNVGGAPAVIPGEDSFSVAVLSLFGVSATSAAIGLLVNWLLASWLRRVEPEDGFAE